MTAYPDAPRLAFVIPDLRGGGAERVMLQLARGFAGRGARIDVVVRSTDGPLAALVPADAELLDLGTRRMASMVVPLRRHLARTAPTATVSALSHVNVVTLTALRSLRNRDVHAVVTEHSHLALVHAETRSSARMLPMLMRSLYPRAAAVVAVSAGVADGLQAVLRGRTANLHVVANPVDVAELERLASSDVTQHPWLGDGGPPLIVTLGRLSSDKDHVALLRAFASVREQQPCRLVIVGEGEERASLEALARTLGVDDAVAMPGFTTNPYPYLRAASVFVLSSVHEGLPTALLEAVALRVPSVSTDCPSGPREILEDGRNGTLVPVGDVGALADAIGAMLREPRRPGADAIAPYRLDTVLDRYAELMGLR